MHITRYLLMNITRQHRVEQRCQKASKFGPRVPGVKDNRCEIYLKIKRLSGVGVRVYPSAPLIYKGSRGFIAPEREHAKILDNLLR